ncbi:BT4734/BF3469 family protein [uncultured Bacteroides sp.]|uniref:BT4734/BF3469 family protein n=1 Tax=uncultured Bacteroides sp. TaxID=162156 RepID=UPI002AA8AEAB|nr:BT4734/BF3469 family protein [uncultured Bacteroides sp.]
MKITLLRKEDTRDVLRIVKLNTALENMKMETRLKPVSTLRQNLQYASNDSRIINIERIPRMVFQTEFERSEDAPLMKAYNGLVMISVGGLGGVREAAAVRRRVSALPQTMVAFIGASARSVKIIVPFSRPDGSLPQTYEEAELFHASAYRWAVSFYQGQLQSYNYRVTLQRPSLESGCRFSYDPDLYFSPDAYPIHLEQPVQMPAERTYRQVVEAETDPLKRMMPGYKRTEIISTLFETSLYAALGEIGNYREGGDVKPLLTELARNCFHSGIPEEEVVGWTMMHFRRKIKEILVRQTVHNVYSVEKYFGKSPCLPLKQSMAIQTDEFMNRRYDFRYNTMSTVVEYREKNTFFFDFRPLTERVLNTIAVNALNEGLDLWDRDVKRWVNSGRVPLFSPIEDFLCDLPLWDGKDRIRALASYVPCENGHWPDFFHRWFLSMVAHWRGTDKKYANSTSPLLIGEQGCGKSTFCLNILPPPLRLYYTDSIDFSRKRDAELQLNRFALINIDEFDQVSANHQGFLKHILQKPVVNTRKPHQTAVQELRRYASFIATSNHADLLTDTSGSRRFICINVTGTIRNDVAINYGQLYAQAVQEIRNGERYWFSPEEEAIMMESNQEFEQQNPAEQLFQQYFCLAEEGEDCEKLLAVEILGRLQKKSGFKLSSTKIVHFGRILRKLNVPMKKAKNGNYYCVKER